MTNSTSYCSHTTFLEQPICKLPKNIQSWQQRLPKCLCLAMIPYPSGDLHVGHIRNYVICDVLRRLYAYFGFNALMPMGWDSFGLPAEKAAKAAQLTPSDWTTNNISKMRRQMSALSFSINWSYELTTHCYSYYRWTQALIAVLIKLGVAYKTLALVNWDPVDCTVLSNEQVLNGRGWRSDALVVKRMVSSMFIHLKWFAQQLLDDVTTINWPFNIQTAQQNWISSYTIFRVKLLVFAWPQLAINNSVLHHTFESYKQLFVCGSQRSSLWFFSQTLEAQHMFVWPLLKCMAVKLLCSKPFVKMRSSKYYELFYRIHHIKQRLVAHIKLRWLSCDSIILQAHLLCRNGGGCITQDHGLTDWNVTRQRAWGTPQPFLCCNCTWSDFLLDSTLASCTRQRCLWCKMLLHDDCNTLDTFVDSTWYAYRFTNHQNLDCFVNARSSEWLPVQIYVGGAEHANSHLLFSRLVSKALCRCSTIGLTEPFYCLINQGMVLKEAFYIKQKHGGLDWVNQRTYKTNQHIYSAGVCKMSKSKQNTIKPNCIVGCYGNDVVRAFTVTIAPPNQNVKWTTSGLTGISRLAAQMWKLNFEFKPTCQLSIVVEVETTWVQTMRGLLCLQTNLVVPMIHKLVSLVSSNSSSCAGLCLRAMVLVLTLAAPLFPHLCLVLWRKHQLHTKFGSIVHPRLYSWITQDCLVSFNVFIKQKYVQTVTVPKLFVACYLHIWFVTFMPYPINFVFTTKQVLMTERLWSIK